MFDHILNWKLLKGSHPFPGPEGGTCINEAAIVAAGFKYRTVDSCEDCPPCFSRPIAGYAIGLNDQMPDDVRHALLMPFVTRLAGTADTPAVEQARNDLIVMRTVRDILPIALRACGLGDCARQCEAVKDFNGTYVAAHAAAHASFSKARLTSYAMCHSYGYAAAVAAAEGAGSVGTVAVAHAATAVAHAASTVPNAVAKIFSISVSILDEAIKLGNQAAPIEPALVVERMETMKRRALETA